METYRISRNAETLAFIEAASPEQAAAKFAHRTFGRRTTALRVTGTRGLTGYFQAYIPLRPSGDLNSVGNAFHVF